jgi:hypothetical protein
MRTKFEKKQLKIKWPVMKSKIKSK